MSGGCEATNASERLAQRGPRVVGEGELAAGCLKQGVVGKGQSAARCLKQGQGRIEAYTPPAQGRGPGLRGARKGPGAYQSRAQCAWGKKEGKKGKKGKKGKTKKEKKGKKEKNMGALLKGLGSHGGGDSWVPTSF